MDLALITYNGWCAIKPDQTKPNHYTIKMDIIVITLSPINKYIVTIYFIKWILLSITVLTINKYTPVHLKNNHYFHQTQRHLDFIISSRILYN